MVEKVFKLLLDTFLSEFVEGASWDEKNIHAAVYDGFILLENLVRHKYTIIMYGVTLSIGFYCTV